MIGRWKSNRNRDLLVLHSLFIYLCLNLDYLSVCVCLKQLKMKSVNERLPKSHCKLVSFSANLAVVVFVVFVHLLFHAHCVWHRLIIDCSLLNLQFFFVHMLALLVRKRSLTTLPFSRSRVILTPSFVSINFHLWFTLKWLVYYPSCH